MFEKRNNSWICKPTDLQDEFLKTLLHVDTSFGTTFNEEAAIFPCKVDPFFFADNPFTVLQKMRTLASL